MPSLCSHDSLQIISLLLSLFHFEVLPLQERLLQSKIIQMRNSGKMQILQQNIAFTINSKVGINKYYDFSSLIAVEV